MAWYLLVLLFCRDIVLSHASASPRSHLSRSPSPANTDPIGLNQTNRGTGLGYNSSLIQNSLLTYISSTITSQTNSISTEHQTSYRWVEKVCGARMEEVLMLDGIVQQPYFNFTAVCALWDSSCPGNDTLATGMYIVDLSLSSLTRQFCRKIEMHHLKNIRTLPSILRPDKD